MFKKILIANRGEITCRVAATARRLGIRTVAVYSDADANAKHVRACDEAVAISVMPGGNAPQDSYLRIEAILAAARATGAEAVHPGYGFLSENEDFARACAGAGLVFIGPPASAIQAMGLKAEAKRLMEQAGVPLVPGYHGADQSPELLRREAEAIGYPVLIKASAGGGGKGMRVVERAQDFDAALEACRREAARSFGDDAVLIEKYLLRPRHIEIQVFTDTQGQGVYLFERDCSVQRRHQKVLEEAPAPGLSDTLRRQMGRAALSAAQAVGYVGAGTVEFIVEQTTEDDASAQGAVPSGARHTPMKFYFMEMNTRLQVEHPVTEAITGLDLVEWQLRVAAGQSLPLTQDQLHINGHAIEARLCAENPDTGFLPATGRLAVYRKPPAACYTRADAGTGFVRVDDGVEEGDEITPWYDPMIAKLIVHGATREEALARLDAALAQVRIVGVANNVQFLRHVLATPSFAHARLDTGLIERESARLFGREPLGLPLRVAAVVARVLADEATETTDVHPVTPSSPFARRDGWRAWGQATRRFDFVCHEQKVHALLRYGPAEQRHLTVSSGADSAEGLLSFQPLPEGVLDLGWASERRSVAVHRQHAQWQVFTAEGAGGITYIDALTDAAATHEVAGRLVAPMPGKVLSFAVRAGDLVRQGQVLAVMEAMKMEHAITAPADGTVEALLYAQGDQVAEGAELLRLGAAVALDTPRSAS
ncbi:acetyl/propionyl/methylcrotonyl-CoA carboxylase subunit alpha [Hylemonella gracilis]|uniref:Carbamoyl-phosphate synthase l chain ATP-binding protein n=1 Tax=Hylemonella gracilis ATCC 19624 TaxID=887062 RepID=F3KUV3_9BURK|nr:biotin carboxylase N-terminal domain-containing protein [Hylemonella gracilis]EGI76446.1 carbamoyl-phosphate synthase l chain ATP-binding protein [Hylemonella gracilis ATCC 19624]